MAIRKVPTEFYQLFEASLMLIQQLKEASDGANRELIEVSKDTNFNAIIKRTRSDEGRLLQESKAFAEFIEKWTYALPKLMEDIMAVIGSIESLLSQEGYLVLSKDLQNNIRISFNQREFLFELKREAGMTPTLTYSKEHLELLRTKEYEMVRELAEILHLDIELSQYLLATESRIQKWNVNDYIRQARDAGNAETMIMPLRSLFSFWQEEMAEFTRLIPVIKTAIIIDAKAMSLINESLRDKGHLMTPERLGCLLEWGDILLNILGLVPVVGQIANYVQVGTILAKIKKTKEMTEQAFTDPLARVLSQG